MQMQAQKKKQKPELVLPSQSRWIRLVVLPCLLKTDDENLKAEAEQGIFLDVRGLDVLTILTHVQHKIKKNFGELNTTIDFTRFIFRRSENSSPIDLSIKNKKRPNFLQDADIPAIQKGKQNVGEKKKSDFPPTISVAPYRVNVHVVATDEEIMDLRRRYELKFTTCMSGKQILEKLKQSPKINQDANFWVKRGGDGEGAPPLVSFEKLDDVQDLSPYYSNFAHGDAFGPPSYKLYVYNTSDMKKNEPRQIYVVLDNIYLQPPIVEKGSSSSAGRGEEKIQAAPPPSPHLKTPPHELLCNLPQKLYDLTPHMILITLYPQIYANTYNNMNKFFPDFQYRGVWAGEGPIELSFDSYKQLSPALFPTTASRRVLLEHIAIYVTPRRVTVNIHFEKSNQEEKLEDIKVSTSGPRLIDMIRENFADKIPFFPKFVIMREEGGEETKEEAEAAAESKEAQMEPYPQHHQDYGGESGGEEGVEEAEEDKNLFSTPLLSSSFSSSQQKQQHKTGQKPLRLLQNVEFISDHLTPEVVVTNPLYEGEEEEEKEKEKEKKKKNPPMVLNVGVLEDKTKKSLTKFGVRTAAVVGTAAAVTAIVKTKRKHDKMRRGKNVFFENNNNNVLLGDGMQDLVSEVAGLISLIKEGTMKNKTKQNKKQTQLVELLSSLEDDLKDNFQLLSLPSSSSSSSI